MFGYRISFDVKRPV